MPDSPTPQLAHLLSDLATLRVCDPAAALALVSAGTAPTSQPSDTATATSKPLEAEKKDADGDEDVARAKELVALHYAVKEAHRRGELGAALAEARASVERAVGGIGS